MSRQVIFGHIKFMVPLLGISISGNGVINLYIYDLVSTSFWRRCRGSKEFKNQYSDKREKC